MQNQHDTNLDANILFWLRVTLAGSVLLLVGGVFTLTGTATILGAITSMVIGAILVLHQRELRDEERILDCLRAACGYVTFTDIVHMTVGNVEPPDVLAALRRLEERGAVEQMMDSLHRPTWRAVLPRRPDPILPVID